MNRDEITSSLKLLKSFESSVKIFEEVMRTPEEGRFNAAPCRVTLYSDMPMGSGSGSRAPTLTGQMGLSDIMEYQQTQHMVRWLRIALGGLNYYEREVVEQKWVEGHTLARIAEMQDVSIDKVKNIHRSAMKKMEDCLKLIDYHPSITVRQRESTLY